MRHTHIIGAGGIGGWLAKATGKLIDPNRLSIWDADKVEMRNLDRQFFYPVDIGVVKSTVLAEDIGCISREKFFSFGEDEFGPDDWILCAADNNRTRRDVLTQCDFSGCRCIIGANEVFSAEAYIYLPWWKDTPKDPRKWMPEILEDHGLDPLAPLGCTGEAQVKNRQLVSANMMAASLILNFFVAWAMEFEKMTEAERGELEGTLPNHHVVTMTRILSATHHGELTGPS